MVRLERLRIPTAAGATEPFLDEALEQARALGMPDYRMVYVPHPVQLLTLHELHGHADAGFDEVVARPTGPRHGGRRSAGRLRRRRRDPHGIALEGRARDRLAELED